MGPLSLDGFTLFARQRDRLLRRIDRIVRKAAGAADPIRNRIVKHGVRTGIAVLLAGMVGTGSGPHAEPGVPAAEAEILLDALSVDGSREGGLGPVPGLVARQSFAGTKSDTPLVETPQSISVIAREQVRLQQATTLGETLRYTPGVVAEPYGGTDLRIDQSMIRGFANAMPFVDGLTTNGRYTLLSTSIEPYGVERVSVVRGPISVLYGQTVPGGLIDIVSKRPLDQPVREIEVQGGGTGRVQGAFDLSGPATPDGTLLYRLVGLTRDGGTQVDRVGTRRLYLAPALTWRPGPDTTVTLLSHAEHADDGFAAQNLPAEGTLYRHPILGRIPTHLFVGEPGFNTLRRDAYAVGYSLEHRVGEDALVRQSLRYAWLGTAIRFIGTAGFRPGTTLLNRFSLSAQAHQASVALDTQGQVQFDTGALRHTLVAGVDYARAQDHWVERDGDADPLDLARPVHGGAVTRPEPDFGTSDTLAQIGLYAQDQVRWTHLTLTGGLRSDWADTTVKDLIVGSTAPQHDRAVTGRIGLTDQLDGGLAPYVSYATSFLPTVGATFDRVPYRPGAGEQIEGGLKYQPPGLNSFVMLSGYDLSQTHVLMTDPVHPFFRIQTGALRVQGFEASAVANLDTGWTAMAAYTCTQAAITKGEAGLVGHRPAGVPRTMASLWIDRTLVGGPLAGFGLGGGLRSVGQRFGDTANRLSIPANVLFDLGIHYRHADWRAAITVKNLLDTITVGTCDSVAFCYYGQRRTVLGTLTYRW